MFTHYLLMVALQQQMQMNVPPDRGTIIRGTTVPEHSKPPVHEDKDNDGESGE